MLTGKQLLNIGFEKGKIIGLVLATMEKEYSDLKTNVQLDLLKRVLENPALYIDNPKLTELAKELMKPKEEPLKLSEENKYYKIYGADVIEEGAINQMNTAMKLPVTVAGALMPDAHQGYGLPIGGVLATKNAVIPYGVGVDIGCRMCMTIYDVPVSSLFLNSKEYKKLLTDNTRFGLATFKKPKDDEILSRKEFNEIDVIRKLKSKAAEQIGSSGGGNHFVEFGDLEILHDINEYNLKPGKYLAILSHSGSRGLGANIAQYYTKLAIDSCRLPPEAKNLAWLDLNTEKGQEYWMAMNLAGDYASACHHHIHARMAESLGETPLAMIENHHNFAWKELDEKGEEIIVHRKGATPASEGTLGIIPGSMASHGFIVKGKGNRQSINSASHGAGRLMSRTKAKQTIDPRSVKSYLQNAGVEVLGSGLDEAPMAYKDINMVMNFQKDLVSVLGTFMPRIVRMCGDERFKEKD